MMSKILDVPGFNTSNRKETVFLYLLNINTVSEHEILACNTEARGNSMKGLEVVTTLFSMC